MVARDHRPLEVEPERRGHRLVGPWWLLGRRIAAIAAARVEAGAVTTVGRNAVTPKRGKLGRDVEDAVRFARDVDAAGAVALQVDEPRSDHEPAAVDVAVGELAGGRVDHDFGDQVAVDHEVGTNELAVDQHLPAAVAAPGRGLSAADRTGRIIAERSLVATRVRHAGDRSREEVAVRARICSRERRGDPPDRKKAWKVSYIPTSLR